MTGGRAGGSSSRPNGSGGGFQGGYGGVTTPVGTHGGGGGSTAVWVQVASNVSIALARGQYRGQDGLVTITWVVAP